jgi:hypothetical protein
MATKSGLRISKSENYRSKANFGVTYNFYIRSRRRTSDTVQALEEL